MFGTQPAVSGLIADFKSIEERSSFPRRPLTFKEKLKYCLTGEYYVKYHPPKPIPGKKTLVLDLDETLTHTELYKPIEKVHYFSIKNNMYVYLRPGLKQFLEYCRENFDLFIFTASEQKYADQIINKIAPFIDAEHRLYRNSCYPENGFLRKDLSILKRPKEDIIFVDDNLNVFLANRKNSLPVYAWKGSRDDDALLKTVMPVLEKCLTEKDVRPVLLRSRVQRRHSNLFPFF